MDRRTFMRATVAAGATVAVAAVGGLAGTAGEVGVATPSQSWSSATTRYRGTRSGEIHVSHDSGRTWSLLTKFGSDVPVARVGPGANGRVVATLTYRGHPFKIALQDDHRTWLTV